LASAQAADDARTAVSALRARLEYTMREVTVSERSLALADIGVDNTVVRAPFAGVVTVKAAQPGEMVSPLSAGGGFTRTGIGTIVDMDSLEIQVDVNESFINRVVPGQPVEATLIAYPEWKIPAEVVAIIPAADRTKATVRVRIAMKVSDPRVVPDMGVRVAFLRQGEPPALVAATPGVGVPASAVRDVDGETVVYVLGSDGRLSRRSVDIGPSVGDRILIARGVSVGEHVVVAPPGPLGDGASATDASPAGTR
jgi:RND family efflux transporter MFP subunit